MVDVNLMEIIKTGMISMLHNNPFHFWAVVFILFVGAVSLIAGIAGLIYSGTR